MSDRVAGVDVSHWHPVTNWALLAGAASFIGIKATEGAGNTDPTLQEHRRGFHGSALKLAIYYHLARPGDAAAQARRFAAAVGPLAPNERLCLDIERSSGIDQAYLDGFFGTLLGNGGLPVVTSRPLVYASSGSWKTNGLDPAWDLAKACDLWLASYNDVMGPPAPPWAAPTFWQYSETGKVAGVSPPCDLNWFLGDDAALTAYVAAP